MSRVQYHRARGWRDYSLMARLLWVTVAVVVLALLSLFIWMRVRSPAEVGNGVTDQPSVTEVGTERAMQMPTSGTADDIIYHGEDHGRREIALSFDDGPHPRYTPIILEILAEYGIRATFFMIGENVTYYPAAARAVVKAGHEIGNHTFTHRGVSQMDEAGVIAELEACERAIASVTDVPPRFLRPPQGNLGETLRQVAGERDYRIVLWDLDTRDWAHTPASSIAEHILRDVKPGDIILMHDFIGHDSPTPEALRIVIPALIKAGYQFVTVGELIDGRADTVGGAETGCLSPNEGIKSRNVL